MPAPFTTARNPLLSLFQSAAHAFARQTTASPAQAAEHPLARSAAHIVATRNDGRRAYSPPAGIPAMSVTCAGLGLQLLQAIAARDGAREQALRDRLGYSQCDPRWAETLAAYARTFRLDGTPAPIPYIRYADPADFVITAPSPTMRIALLSDWGTGTQQARRVARLLAQQQPDAVIHLGDIYFSGTPEECSAHFLEPLRAVLPDQRLFTLCGNHDVYSGGGGYYGLLRHIGQPASYFCLRSPDRSWQLLAADTGLNDRNPLDEPAALTRIDPAEEAWHLDKLQGFAGQTVLLSHHQPFSAFAQIGPAAQHSPTNPNLMATHARLAQAGTIDAWFWGHEHRLRRYAPYLGVMAGRNIGYGAIPVEAVPGPETPLPGLIAPPPVLGGESLDVVEGAYVNGFALLDLAPGRIEASFWQVTQPGGPIVRESFPRAIG